MNQELSSGDSSEDSSYLEEIILRQESIISPSLSQQIPQIPQINDTYWKRFKLKAKNNFSKFKTYFITHKGKICKVVVFVLLGIYTIVLIVFFSL